MKAVRIHEFGGPEAMQYEDIPTPTPGSGQVLVKLAAGGLNFMEHTFALKDVAASHRSLEGRKTTGKVLLIP